jgi:3-dehydroquinate synthase
MKTIKSLGYDIFFESKKFSALNAFLKKKKYSSVFIICDENTLPNCLPLLIRNCSLLQEAEIIEIEQGEKSKDLDIAAMIWQTLADNKADRDSLVLNLGGGVVSDLGAFAASVYKRGISFINVPTSLLAMADASVGGKTGIDFSEIKNLIGTFQQPAGVFICIDFLKTLPARHFKNGLTEIYKIALVADSKLWNGLDRVSVEEAIYRSVELKNKIVKKDPFDRKERKALNFGHTIGHAFEALRVGRADELLHGEAVAAGMIIESDIAFQKKLISKKEYESIKSTIASLFRLSPFMEAEFDAILSFMSNDKKSKGGKVKFALPKGIGKCDTDVEVSDLQIQKALLNYAGTKYS